MMLKKIMALALAWVLIAYAASVSADGNPVNDYQQQKYGIFIHYGWGNVPGAESGYPITQYPDGSYPQSVDEVADNFDVQGFVDGMAAMSPEYVIFTAWHGGMFPLFPSQKQQEWLGGGRYSQRDVLGEVVDGLNAHDIKIYFYVNPMPGNSFSDADKAATGFINANTYVETFDNFVHDVIGEILDNYGSRIDGWWFDIGLYNNAIDRERLRNLVLSEIPNAVIIANRFANDAADYGAVETKVPTVTFNRDYDNISNSDEETWPSYSRSVAFVQDQGWWATPGSARYTSTQMYKYTVLQAAVNLEGGGTAWSIGPYPGFPVTYNNGVYDSMVDLGQKIDAVGESIKNTYPSTSWPTLRGSRINELTWGVATRSIDDHFEYVHVLKAPVSGDTLTIDAAADGKIFSAGINLRTGNAVSVSQSENALSLTLHTNDAWDAVDTVIKLTVAENYEVRTNIALGKTVTTSSELGGSEGSKAFDEDVTTQWYAPDSEPSWMVVDLGSDIYSVSQFVVKHAGLNETTQYNTRQFQIQSSASPTGPWTTLVDSSDDFLNYFSGGNSQNISSYDAGISAQFTNPIYDRYIRLYVTDAALNSDTTARINEFEIWGRAIDSIPNPDPEPETVKVDNTSGLITYSGSWVQNDHESDYLESVHRSTQANDYAEFTFTGSSIKVGLREGKNGGIVDIMVDGEIVVNDYDTYSSSPNFQQVIYQSDLSSGEHTVKLIVTGQKNASAGNTYGMLDYFEYEAIE